MRKKPASAQEIRVLVGIRSGAAVPSCTTRVKRLAGGNAMTTDRSDDQSTAPPSNWLTAESMSSLLKGFLMARSAPSNLAEFK